MPIQPTYPGVYVQEVPSGVRTITGVATSIAAFFGRTQKGQINKAVRCLSYSDFQREFNGPHRMSDLATSVRQFFDNGGTDCYVVRIAGAGNAAAAITLRRLSKGDPLGSVLTATAKAPGLWGQDIRLDVDYNTSNPDDTFNLRVSLEKNSILAAQEYHQNLSMNPNSKRFAPDVVKQSSNLIDLVLHGDMGLATDPGSNINTIGNTPAGYSQSRRIFSDNSAGNLLNQVLNAVDPAKNGNKTSFFLKLNGDKEFSIDLTGIDLTAGPPADPPAVAATLQSFINNQIHLTDPAANVKVEWKALSLPNSGIFEITSDSAPFVGVNIRRGAVNDLATDLMLGLDQGGIEVARYSNMRPIPNGSYFWGDKNFHDFTDKINDFAVLAQTDINQITIEGRAIALNLDTGQNRMFKTANGLNGVTQKLQMIAQTVNADPNSPATAEVWGSYHLVFKKKSGSLNDKMAIVTAPAAGVGFGKAFALNTNRFSLGALGDGDYQLAGIPGNDGGALKVSDYTGDSSLHTGFYSLDRIDLFNLMIIPHDDDISESDYQNLFGPATTYCEKRRAFLLIDAPASWTNGETMNADATKVNSLRAGIVKGHSAIFYPRVKYSEAGILRQAGPSGLIAGLMARTDSQRGVWKAPAGIEADLRNVLDVELNMTDGENGVLNKLGVNCIRKFPDGVVNWGARTLEGSDDFQSEWKYIPIRRLALFLEESLYRGTKWVVFEPNDEPLWAKIRMNVNAFMMGLFRQGAFQGSTPDKAFFVKCDGETTTANDRNLGIVNIEVGFAPLKPAEFVIISIQQIPDV